MNGFGATLTRDEFVWALASMCRTCSRSFDQDILLRGFPPPHSLEALLRAAAALGIRTCRATLPLARLARLALPCLLLLKGAPGNGEGGSRATLAVMLRLTGEGAELIESGSREIRRVPVDELGRIYAGESIGFSTTDVDAAEFQPAAMPSRAFGLRTFLGELFRHHSLWRDVLAGSLVLQLLALALPLLTQAIIDKVVAQQTVQTLWVVASALLLVAVFSALLTWLRQYLLLYLGNRVDATLSLELFAHLLALPPRYFHARPTGTLIARLQGIGVIREFVSGAALLLAVELPFALIFLFVMLWYSPMLTAIAASVLLLIMLLTLGVGPSLRKRLDRQFLAGARSQAFLTEHVAGIETVKSLQMEPQLRRRYESLLGDQLDAAFRARLLAGAYQVGSQSLEHILTIAVLCVGAWLVMQNDGFTVGMLVAFQMFTLRAAQPLVRIAGMWQEFQQALVAVRRLGDLADAPVEPSSLAGSGVRCDAPGLEIEDVWVRYSERDTWALKGLNVSIPFGSMVAVTGPSGSGKSTLARLLQGIVLPQRGGIRLGGRDLRFTPVNELRSQLGVVPQESVLFSGTLRENLLLAAPEASDADMRAAATFAEIHDFIATLPEGYETRVGEHGVGLSGGQLQRLAIARALLRRPSVLILDEATSQLEAVVAAQIAETLAKLRGRVTVLFIGHHVPDALAPDITLDLAQAASGSIP